VQQLGQENRAPLAQPDYGAFQAYFCYWFLLFWCDELCKTSCWMCYTQEVCTHQ
jgi:hypothetical protein